MGELRFFPGVVAEEVLREREDAQAETMAGIKLVLGDIESLVEAQRGLCQDGAWRNARSYLLGEQEMRIAVLRELLGVA
jgi:hypothetical protein